MSLLKKIFGNDKVVSSEETSSDEVADVQETAEETVQPEINPNEYYMISLPSQFFDTFEELEKRDAMWAAFMGSTVLVKLNHEDQMMFKLAGVDCVVAGKDVPKIMWDKLKPFTAESAKATMDKIKSSKQVDSKDYP